jgi:hypothetical protein
MEDREWYREIEADIADLQDRVRKLECGSGSGGPTQEIIELDIEWPEADIDGLHFNRQEVKGVFDLKKDGKYHSRDILFLSARNTEDNNSRDILLKYLRSDKVQKAFLGALINANYPAETVEVSLPAKNEGVKKYNGVYCWYWLLQKAGNSESYFAGVGPNSFGSGDAASGVGGCAPTFSLVITEFSPPA